MVNFPKGVKPWHTLSEYMVRFKEVGVSMNGVFLVGFGTVRKGVIGDENRSPTNDELDEMKTLIAQTMQEGAFGMSTGLMYPPQNYAETSEVIECAKVVAKYGGFYATHTRRRGYEWGDRPLPEYLDNFVVPWVDTKVEAIRETIKIGEKAGLPVHMSHFKAAGKVNWGKMKTYLAMIDDARRRGIDVTIDTCYPPYKARGAGLTHQLPTWVSAAAKGKGGGLEAIRALLKDPETRARIKKELKRHMEGHQKEESWDDQLILRVNLGKNNDLIGKTVAEAAKMRDMEPVDFALDSIAEGETAGGVAFIIGDEDLQTVAKYPFSMICSDSGPTNTTVKTFGHPRIYGTFPRFLRVYVREQNILKWEQAIHKITGLPASRLGLWDRGIIRPGNWADITTFDPIRIQDNATYQNPVQYSEGVQYVMVNGVLTMDGGKHTGAAAGQPLKHKVPVKN
jgi:N-acyl-D-amino-acid deacylase